MDDIKKMMKQCLQMAWDAVTDANLEAIEEGRVVSIAEWDEIMVNTLIANGVTIPVHCKDCKHWFDGVAGCTDHVKCCKIGYYMVGENGYCVYGERRTDG